MLLAFGLQGCVSSRNRSIREWKKSQWQLVKADKQLEPSWTIYKRKLLGTNFVEFKIEGSIGSSPEACIAAFRQDIHNLANGLESKKYPTYEIVDESTDSLLTYVIHKEPFPFKNTEMRVRYYFRTDAEGRVGEATWEEAWEGNTAPPTTKKLSRVKTFRGSWHFSSISNQYSKAISMVRFDPKKMPNWLVSPMVTKFLRKSLKDIREMTSNENKIQ